VFSQTAAGMDDAQTGIGRGAMPTCLGDAFEQVADLPPVGKGRSST